MKYFFNEIYCIKIHPKTRGVGRILQKGDDVRREMQTPLRSEVWGLLGVWGCQRPMTTCSWNDWFNFLSLLIPLFSLFLSSSPLTLLLSPFFVGRGAEGAAAPPPLHQKKGERERGEEERKKEGREKRNQKKKEVEPVIPRTCGHGPGPPAAPDPRP